MVRAGPMRHIVTLQVRSTIQDGAGEPTLVWNEFATRRASVQRAPGSEVFDSAQRGGRVPVVLRMRYLPGVTSALRLLLGGRVHDIVSAVDLEGRREELVVTAVEHVEESP